MPTALLNRYLTLKSLIFLDDIHANRSAEFCRSFCTCRFAQSSASRSAQSSAGRSAQVVLHIVLQVVLHMSFCTEFCRSFCTGRSAQSSAGRSAQVVLHRVLQVVLPAKFQKRKSHPVFGIAIWYRYPHCYFAMILWLDVWLESLTWI